MHRRKRFVLNVDLQDFFDSINFGRVRGMFMAKPYLRNKAVATLLAQICCFDNRLPQGAPTSPAVSNMVCGKLDADLRRLANRVNVTYTRYADDLTFSTNETAFPRALSERDHDGSIVAGRELGRVVESNGFTLNAAKTRLLTRADRQEVTGLTVNAKVNVSRRYVRKVRAMLHRLSTHPETSFARQVAGRLDFIGQVRGRTDAMYRRMLDKYAAAVPGFIVPPLPNPELLQLVERNTWVVESMTEEKCDQGTAVLVRGVGFVTCAHVIGRHTYAYRPETPNEHRAVRILHVDEGVDLALIEIEDASDEGGGIVLSDRMPDALQEVYVAGFPSFAPGSTVQIHRGEIAGRRTINGFPILSLGPVVYAGASGGPVLNDANEIVGIAVRGASDPATAEYIDRYGAIPVESLRDFLSRVPER